MAMEALVERCAGLDVHQASVVCCVLFGPPGCRPRKLLRTFGTTTHELGKLRAWLAEHGVTHVGMLRHAHISEPPPRRDGAEPVEPALEGDRPRRPRRGVAVPAAEAGDEPRRPGQAPRDGCGFRRAAVPPSSRGPSACRVARSAGSKATAAGSPLRPSRAWTSCKVAAAARAAIAASLSRRAAAPSWLAPTSRPWVLRVRENPPIVPRGLYHPATPPP